MRARCGCDFACEVQDLQFRSQKWGDSRWIDPYNAAWRNTDEYSRMSGNVPPACLSPSFLQRQVVAVVDVGDGAGAGASAVGDGAGAGAFAGAGVSASGAPTSDTDDHRSVNSDSSSVATEPPSLAIDTLAPLSPKARGTGNEHLRRPRHRRARRLKPAQSPTQVSSKGITAGVVRRRVDALEPADGYMSSV